MMKATIISHTLKGRPSSRALPTQMKVGSVMPTGLPSQMMYAKPRMMD